MSRLVWTIGDVLHLHLPHSALGFAVPEGFSRRAASVPTEAGPAAPPTDDLAFFSLSVPKVAEDGRAALEHLGLVGSEDEARPRLL